MTGRYAGLAKLVVGAKLNKVVAGEGFGRWPGGLTAGREVATSSFYGRRSGRFKSLVIMEEIWLRGKDLNLRPLGYEPNELPGCSTPRSDASKREKAKSRKPAQSRLSSSFRADLKLLSPRQDGKANPCVSSSWGRPPSPFRHWKHC
jgi:hypothetical protein